MVNTNKFSRTLHKGDVSAASFCLYLGMKDDDATNCKKFSLS